MLVPPVSKSPIVLATTTFAASYINLTFRVTSSLVTVLSVYCVPSTSLDFSSDWAFSAQLIVLSE